MKNYIVSLLTLIFLSATLAADVAQKVDTFLDVSGANKQINSYPAFFEKGAEQAINRKPDLTEQDQKIISKLMVKSFTAESFRNSIRQALVTALTDQELDEVLKFYETDIARRITELEVKGTSPDIMDKLKSFDPDSVKLKKRNEIDKMITALNMIENALDSQKITMLAMFQVMTANLPPEQRRTSEQINNDIDKIIEKIRPNYEVMIKKSLYMIYGVASLKTIKSYVEYLNQPAVKKLYKNFNSGKQLAMKKGATAFGQNLVNYFEKKK